MNIGEAIAILTEFAKVAGNEAEMSVSSFNLQARVDSEYNPNYSYSYPSSHKPKRVTTYQVIASYPHANNYDHIPEKLNVVYADKESA